MNAFDIPVNITNDLERRIAESFLIFDLQGNKTVDYREIGTILRFLGCVPTEAEVNEIVSATEFEDSGGTVHLSRFLPHVCQLLFEHKMQPASPEKLLEAFQLLDVDGKGYVSKEYLSNLMISEGEPFSQEELDEMMATAVDNTTGMIPYEYYLNQLMHEPKDSIYALADVISDEIKRSQLPRPSQRKRQFSFT